MTGWPTPDDDPGRDGGSSPYPGPPPTGQPQFGQPQYGQPQYGQPQYGQPQYPTSPAQAGPYSGAPYPGAPYPGAPYPQAGPYPGAPYPGAPYPGGPYPGGPYPGAPYPGYPRMDANPRPGTALASAVLAYVAAGLLILAAGLLLIGASITSGVENAVHSQHSYGVEFSIDSLLNLVAAGLLITGGILMANGKHNGRVLLGLGAGLVVFESIYWLARADAITRFGGVFYALLFPGLAILSVILGSLPEVTRWLAAKRAPGRR